MNARNSCGPPPFTNLTPSYVFFFFQFSIRKTYSQVLYLITYIILANFLGIFAFVLYHFLKPCFLLNMNFC